MKNLMTCSKKNRKIKTHIKKMNKEKNKKDKKGKNS